MKNKKMRQREMTWQTRSTTHRLPFLSFTSLRAGERKNPRPRSLRPTLMPIAPTSGRPMGRPYECDVGADVDQMISPPFASS